MPITWRLPSRQAQLSAPSPPIDEGFALPPMEKSEALINERTKGIMICNPNNPTGYLYTRKEMNQIRDLVKKYDLISFSTKFIANLFSTDPPIFQPFTYKGLEKM